MLSPDFTVAFCQKTLKLLNPVTATEHWFAVIPGTRVEHLASDLTNAGAMLLDESTGDILK